MLSLLLQVAEVDWTQILSFKDLSAVGILLLVLYYFYKQNDKLEVQVKELRDLREEDLKKQSEINNEYSKKYFDLVMKTNEVIAENIRTNNESTKVMQRIEKLLDK